VVTRITLVKEVVHYALRKGEVDIWGAPD